PAHGRRGKVRAEKSRVKLRPRPRHLSLRRRSSFCQALRPASDQPELRSRRNRGKHHSVRKIHEPQMLPELKSNLPCSRPPIEAAKIGRLREHEPPTKIGRLREHEPPRVEQH